MNYWKAAISGFCMSFIGTALCGSKIGMYEDGKYKYLIKKHVVQNLFTLDITTYKAVFNLKNYNDYSENYNLELNYEGQANFSDFDFDQYYDDNLKATESNFWFKKDDWSVATSFRINNAWCIPTSLLGALFHDKVGRDLTPKINDYFGSEISPYLVTGGLFGVVGTVSCLIVDKIIASYPINDLTKPWLYSLSLMQGFLVGATAMAGAYFGDEEQQAEELSDSVISDHIELNP